MSQLSGKLYVSLYGGNVRYVLRDAFKKKNSIWRDIVPTSYHPLPPFKSRDKNRRDIFWDLDPLPPFKSREIC